MKRFANIPHAVTLLFLPILLLTGCDSNSPDSDENDLEGGVLATFRVEGELFHVWLTNTQAIQQVLDLKNGTSEANIPNGPLVAGPGAGDHNAPWSWHLDPAQTTLAEVTIEVCSGTPSYLEANVDEWVNVVGQYCPWSAELVEVQDFR